MNSFIFCIFKAHRCLAWMQLQAAVRTGLLSLPPPTTEKEGERKGGAGAEI